ncbi:MAG: hypothetical protein QHH24_03870 [Candidatus Bathyarchaeota archaeon]|jgi:5-methyltetrahydropteroyltriglutamate--homocysteine methyltransferase|nr:hypothetical protein [Candidatus Bathyarchaeota archaeon]
MIGCYATGIFPRPEELIKTTQRYVREKIEAAKLEEAFERATAEIVDAQVHAGFAYVSDGMMKWQDLLRPFTENLEGVRSGGLTRWFSNNTFYRKPVIIGELRRTKCVTEKITLAQLLPKNLPWKAILPAPYTLAQLSENLYYKDKSELLFSYAKMLREEIRDLARLGFKYFQLSDPALVCRLDNQPITADEMNLIAEALKVVVKGISAKTCLQTFHGDFSQIMPAALDFPVNHLGVDLYETKFDAVKEYSFTKGVALGLVDARSSLIESSKELVNIAKRVFEFTCASGKDECFICPNCDLEYVPWKRAKKKMAVLRRVAERLREDLRE